MSKPEVLAGFTWGVFHTRWERVGSLRPESLLCLRSRSSEYRIDPARAMTWCASAGGNLAGLAAVSCNAQAMEPAQIIKSAAPDTRADTISSSNVSDCIRGSVTWYGVFITEPNPIKPRWGLLARFCLFNLLILGTFFPNSARANDGEVAPPPAGPLFTGPLLSTRGRTVDQGHVMIEPYFYSTRYGGLYNNSWRVQSTSVTHTNVQQTLFVYGLTSRMDVEIAPQWVGNHSQDNSSVGFGDFPLQLGAQVLNGRSDSWLPDVRIWVQEIFPTGSYNNLSPTTGGLVATGGGSYATTLGIGAQKAIGLTEDHFFRYRVNATYGFYSPVTVQGFNAYGGGFGTNGRVDPGSVTTLIAAGEYTITRHVALALDISFQIANATRFSGTAGVGVNGAPATVGKGYSERITVAPAMEYNWNQHVGVIAGPWFSLSGRNTSEFYGVVTALYLFL